MVSRYHVIHAYPAPLITPLLTMFFLVQAKPFNFRLFRLARHTAEVSAWEVLSWVFEHVVELTYLRNHIHKTNFLWID